MNYNNYTVLRVLVGIFTISYILLVHNLFTSLGGDSSSLLPFIDFILNRKDLYFLIGLLILDYIFLISDKRYINKEDYSFKNSISFNIDQHYRSISDITVIISESFNPIFLIAGNKLPKVPFNYYQEFYNESVFFKTTFKGTTNDRVIGHILYTLNKDRLNPIDSRVISKKGIEKIILEQNYFYNITTRVFTNDVILSLLKRNYFDKLKI